MPISGLDPSRRFTPALASTKDGSFSVASLADGKGLDKALPGTYKYKYGPEREPTQASRFPSCSGIIRCVTKNCSVTMATDSNPDHYTFISLGCGEAGKYIAWTYSSRVPGSRCAVIEKQLIGGSCPNTACLPSKNFVHSAKIASYSKHLNDYGMSINGGELNPVDMAVVRERKRDMVTGLVNMHLDKFKGSGAELIMGTGKFTGKKTLEIDLVDGGKRTVTADVVVVSTGSRAKLDTSIPGLREANPLTHIEMLEIDQVKLEPSRGCRRIKLTKCGAGAGTSRHPRWWLHRT
jgi:hypothetical protein